MFLWESRGQLSQKRTDKLKASDVSETWSDGRVPLLAHFGGKAVLAVTMGIPEGPRIWGNEPVVTNPWDYVVLAEEHLNIHPGHLSSVNGLAVARNIWAVFPVVPEINNLALHVWFIPLFFYEIKKNTLDTLFCISDWCPRLTLVSIGFGLRALFFSVQFPISRLPEGSYLSVLLVVR